MDATLNADTENDEAEADDEGTGAGQRPKRRRGGEVGRDWVCEEEGCEKAFKSVCSYLSSSLLAYDLFTYLH